MHRFLAIVLAVTLIEFPVVQAHDSSHHAQFGVEDPAAHHNDTQPCDSAKTECESNTDTACLLAVSGHCSGSSATMGLSQLVPPPLRSLAASSVASDAMSGPNVQPETPPPRT